MAKKYPSFDYIVVNGELQPEQRELLSEKGFEILPDGRIDWRASKLLTALGIEWDLYYE